MKYDSTSWLVSAENALGRANSRDYREYAPMEDNHRFSTKEKLPICTLRKQLDLGCNNCIYRGVC